MSKDEVNYVDPADIIGKSDTATKTRLTDWKKEPKLHQLKEDYTASKSYHNAHMSRVNDWVDCFAAEGRFTVPKIAGRSSMAPKLVRKQVEWRCPSLTEPFLSNKELLEVSARTFEDVHAAKQNQLVLNYQFQNKMNLVHFMDEVVRTMAVEGTAIIKPTWNYNESTVSTYHENWQEQYDPEAPMKFQQMMEKLNSDEDYSVFLTEGDKLGLTRYMQTEEPVTYVLIEKERVEQLRVTANHPDAEVCDIDDIYFDPTCKGNIDKAKFIIHRFSTCVADLEGDGRYTNLDEVKAHVANNTQEDTVKSDDTGFKFKDDARKQIEAYEYWGYWDVDGSDTLTPIVATWVGNTLIQLEVSPYTSARLPFIFVPLIPIKGSLYGEPDAELLSDNQLIVGAMTRGVIDMMGKSANGQVGTAKGFLDMGNRKKFDQGLNYDYNPELPPERAIYMHKFTEIPRAAFDVLSLMNKDAESLSGVQAFSSGISGDALGKTAVGVRSTMDASAKRDATILRRIAEGIRQLAYRFQELNAIFLTEEDYIRLTNDEFVPINPDNLSGDFDLKIDIATAEEEAAKVADLSMLLQVGQTVFPFEFTQEILAEIADLKKLPNLHRFIKEYKPEPDPMAQRKAELELQRMELENARIRAETFEITNKGLVNGAEVSVREQRAGKLQSDTDNSNLKFFKSAEGIDHQESIDKINAQADANIRSKDVDHLNNIDTLRLNHNAKLLQDGANRENTVERPVRPQRNEYQS